MCLNTNEFNDNDSFARLYCDNYKVFPPWNALKPRPNEDKVSVFHRLKSSNSECHEKGILSGEKRNLKYRGFLVLLMKRLIDSEIIKDVQTCPEEGDDSHCHIVFTHTFVKNEPAPIEITKEINQIIKDSSFIEYESYE
jgi:hypothetical protein